MPEAAGARGHRLFFALWPSDEMRAAIEEATRQWVRESRGRPVPPANLHVTVLFLGQVAENQMEAVTASAAEIAAEPFDISFDRIETWKRSHVLSLTCQHTAPSASKLAHALENRLAAHQMERKEHAFRAHITLARDVARPCSHELTEALQWRVDEFVLVESNMTKTGSQYSVLDRWPLVSAETR